MPVAIFSSGLTLHPLLCSLASHSSTRVITGPTSHSRDIKQVTLLAKAGVSQETAIQGRDWRSKTLFSRSWRHLAAARAPRTRASLVPSLGFGT